MNKIFLLILTLCISYTLFSQTWVKLSDFPSTERDDGLKFSIANKVYCGSGLQVGWTCANDFYAFDLVSETWSSIASMPTTASRQYGVGFSLYGKGYVFGGINDSGVYLNDLLEYDPITNTWLQKASLPALGRAGAVAFVINNIVYIVGGRTITNNAIFETWKYNVLTDSWTQMSNLPISGIWRGVSFENNNLGYVGLGRNNLDQNNKHFFEYNPITNNWIQVAGYSHAGRAYTGYSQIGNLAFLFGGADSLGMIDNAFERIDLTDFSTQMLSPFASIPRKGCIAFTGNNSFYITTGVSTTARFKETWKASGIVGLKGLTEENNELKIYPNPATNELHIISKRDDISTIKVITMLGEELLSFTEGFENMDVSELNKGNYIVVVKLKSNKNTYGKLIIE